MLSPKAALIYFGIYSLVLGFTIGFFFLLMEVENDRLELICIIGYVCLMGIVNRILGNMRKQKN